MKLISGGKWAFMWLQGATLATRLHSPIGTWRERREPGGCVSLTGSCPCAWGGLGRAVSEGQGSGAPVAGHVWLQTLACS